MSDNTQLDGVTVPGGDLLSTDDLGSCKVQRVKLQYGVDGVGTDVNASAPLPVTISSIPLPVGAATAANQILPGVAGTPGTQVMSVQGVAAGVGVNVNIQDGAGNDLTSVVRGGQRALSVQLVDSSGNQITAFGGSGGTAQNDATTFTRGSSSMTPVGGVVEATAPSGLTVAQARAFSLTQAASVRIAIAEGGAAAGAAGTPSTDVITVQGATGMTPIQVAVVPAGVASGTLLSRVKALASTNDTLVSSTPCALLKWGLYNNAATSRAVRVFNVSSSPSDAAAPYFTIILPAGGGSNQDWGPDGIPLSVGFGYNITGLPGDGDTTDCAADDVHGFFLRK